MPRRRRRGPLAARCFGRSSIESSISTMTVRKRSTPHWRSSRPSSPSRVAAQLERRRPLQLGVIIVADHLAPLLAPYPNSIIRDRSRRRTLPLSPRSRRSRFCSLGDAFPVTRERAAAVNRALRPPANRLVVLDPRATLDEAVRVATEHAANLLLAELVGAAVRHQAAVWVTPANVGRT